MGNTGKDNVPAQPETPVVKPNAGTMTAEQLDAYVKQCESQHRELMKRLRALLRLRWAEEAAEKMAKGESD